MNNLIIAQTASPDEATLLAVGLAVYIAIFLLFVIPALVIFWKLFTKAGEAGWKAIIPLYNIIVMAKIAKKSLWVGLVATFFQTSGLLSTVTGIEGLFTLTWLLGLVFILYVINSFIKQYDRGIGAWFIYIFIPLIGVFIVDRANYKGMSTESLQQVASVDTPSQQSAQHTASTPQVASTPTVQTTQPSESQQQNNQ